MKLWLRLEITVYFENLRAQGIIYFIDKRPLLFIFKVQIKVKGSKSVL